MKNFPLTLCSLEAICSQNQNLEAGRPVWPGVMWWVFLIEKESQETWLMEATENLISKMGVLIQVCSSQLSAINVNEFWQEKRKW